MKAYITQTDFIDTFKQSHSYKNNFSYFGLVALFEYLEDYEQDTGEEIEMDMVALCCDFTEYKNTEEFINDYQDYQDMSYSEVMEVLRDETEVIEFKGSHMAGSSYLFDGMDKSFIIRAF